MGDEAATVVTCECAPNIALIKYWGKANDELILPLNSSLSITLDRHVLNTKTSIALTPSIHPSSPVIHLTLNGVTQEMSDEPTIDDEHSSIVTSPNNLVKSKSDLVNRRRFFRMLNTVRANCRHPRPHSVDIRIASRNSFPTACGLASSASGFACLALCLAAAFEYSGDVSELARLGSGSACRSCRGGFVEWCRGETSAMSVARCVAPATHWPELNVLVLVLEDRRKLVSSTGGMGDSVRTSDYMSTRVEVVETRRLAEMKSAIADKNFAALATLTMRDSNSFHAVCLDTQPPLFYMNDKSRHIVRLVDAFNKWNGGGSTSPSAAYSFDAGPNAFLFVLEHDLAKLVYAIYRLCFAAAMDESEFCRAHFVAANSSAATRLDLGAVARAEVDAFCEEFVAASGRWGATEEGRIVKYVMHSRVGEDPVVTRGDWDGSLFSEEEVRLLRKPKSGC